jgi:alkyldihydroxyacetonephosphate synthase
MAATHEAFGELSVPGYIVCHLSHCYHVGPASTSPSRSPPLRAAIRGAVRPGQSAIQQTFIDSGATLSRHHAVGTEHSRWLEQDISAPGVAMVRALLTGWIPGANLNPGKII